MHNMPMHGQRAMPGAKPVNFKRTLGQLIRYMKASVAPIIISFLLAIAAVVLTINIPKITGNATDTLLTGVIQKQIYAAVEKSLEDGATMEGVANGIAAQTGKNVQDITLADLINALGAENGDFAENVPQKYRDAVLNMKQIGRAHV